MSKASRDSTNVRNLRRLLSTPGLYAWFDSADFTGTVWTDRKNNVTAIVTSVTKTGNDAVFGASSVITMGRQTLFEGANKAWTMSFWARNSQAGTVGIMQYDDNTTYGDNTNNLYLLGRPGSLAGYAETSTIESDPGFTSVDGDVWRNWVITKTEGNALAFYQNGVQTATATAADIAGSSSHVLRLGEIGNVSQFTGRMNEFLIYNRAISATEALNHFSLTRSRFGV